MPRSAQSNIPARVVATAPLAWCELTWTNRTYAPILPEDAIIAAGARLGVDPPLPSATSRLHFPLAYVT